LTAGESHFYSGTTSGTSLGAVLNGLDGVFVAGFINKLVARLRGEPKTSRRPTTSKANRSASPASAAATGCSPCSRRSLGSRSKRDNITFRIIGNTGGAPNRSQRGLSAVRVGLHLRDQLASRRLSDLADLGDLNIPFQDTDSTRARVLSPSTRKSSENVLRALLDGITFIQSPDNKSAVLKSLVQWLRLSKTEDAVEGYEFMRKMYTKRIYPTVEGIRNSLPRARDTNEKFRALKAEDLSMIGSSESSRKRARSRICICGYRRSILTKTLEGLMRFR